MDGFKAGLNSHVNDSLQFKLSLFLSLTTLLVALIAGLFSFISAFIEAHELQDDTLRQIALLMDRQQGIGNKPTTSVQPESDSDEETRVTVQRLPNSKASGVRDHQTDDLPLPENLQDGFQTLPVGGEDFRILVRSMADGSRIAVSQETGVRNEIARDSALRTVMPFLLLVPILILLMAVLVRRIFSPISALSAEVNARSEMALHPVHVAGVPVEVRPFVQAINGLLARVQQAMDGQRRFLADAAHELRSPLAALSLQSERLSQADMSETARERLFALRQGIERGRNLLEQLLTLARVQSDTNAQVQNTSVLSIYRRVIEDVMPLAEAKNIDIGVLESTDHILAINEIDLFTMIKNLVDNAIRYAQPGGAVDLSIGSSQKCVDLIISDNGPGIPEHEWPRVFDPFYRVLGSGQNGSGLGLAIVKEITQRIGAKVSLAYTDVIARKGLTVEVKIPLC